MLSKAPLPSDAARLRADRSRVGASERLKTAPGLRAAVPAGLDYCVLFPSDHSSSEGIRWGSGFVLRVDYARWGQTPEDLRHLAVSAPHARTRERALALFDITQHRCAT